MVAMMMVVMMIMMMNMIIIICSYRKRCDDHCHDSIFMTRRQYDCLRSLSQALFKRFPLKSTIHWYTQQNHPKSISTSISIFPSSHLPIFPNFKRPQLEVSPSRPHSTRWHEDLADVFEVSIPSDPGAVGDHGRWKKMFQRIPDADHGAGRFTYIETPKITQFCR